MTKYVEMLRSAPAYEGTAGILPATLEKFFEDDVTRIFWSTYGWMLFDEVVSGYGPQFRAFGDVALQAYLRSADFASWTGSYTGIGLVRANADTETDQQVVFPYNPNLNDNGTMYGILRGSGGTAAPTFYGVRKAHNTNAFYLVKVIAGVETSLAGPYTLSPLAVAGDFSLVRFEVAGTTVRMRTWMVNSPEPSVWHLSVVDADIASGDYKGVGYTKTGAAGDITNGYIEFISIGTGGDEAPVPRSMIERRKYFAEGGNASVVAALLGVLGDDGGSGITAYAPVSTHDFRTGAGDVPPLTAFEDNLVDIGDFERKVGEQLMGAASISYGDLTIVNSGGALDHWNDYNWDGRDYLIYLGGLETGTGRAWPWWDFELINKGTIGNVGWSGPQKFVVSLQDPAALLDRPIQTNRYDVTDYTSWPQATGGRLKPLTYGTVFNVKPVLIDDNLHKYQVHDGPCDITDVRENGASIMGSVTVDYATGTFTLSGSPLGDITCDAQNFEFLDVYEMQDGSSAGQVPNTVQGIARVIAARSGLALDQRNENPYDVLSFPLRNNFATVNDYAGIYIDSDMKVNEALDQLMLSNGFCRFFNRLGRLSLVPMKFTYNMFLGSDILAYVIEQDDIIERSLTPVQRIIPAEVEHLIGNKNYFKQTNIAGSVTDENLRALYGQDGVVSDYMPTETGLDTASQHMLRRQRPTRMTLLTGDTPQDAIDRVNAEAQRLWAIFNHHVMLFKFRTYRYANELEPGQFVKVVHDRWGLSAGVVGQTLGVKTNPKSRVAEVLWAVRRDGQWPVVTADYPYLSAEDFGL